MSAVRSSNGLPTAEAALAMYGLDWDRLERLARKALHDRMGARRVHLAPDRLQDALELTTDQGAKAAREYDPGLAHAHSFAKYLYDRMYFGLDNFLRQERGDSRRGRPLTISVTDTGENGDSEAPVRQLDFDELVVDIRGSLSTQAQWALDHLARPVYEGRPLVLIARRYGCPSDVAEWLLGEVRAEILEAHADILMT